ncbi:hypothetical protein Afil01_63150 [Actinorhabdospora filicis]|uniref:Pvc16 N-terminal domain-containing protein n=1 Tax=Actinorhabdospora filicis TaxID=1785913 RepID=A0A9W6SSZ2_9ACTN|nr:DUF4255 domain-containing protein [Actinorhabdospora filicis]GLZ81508.1 hypothetical protein Afil01_63150 [Actinorhabdospora filicis]
MSNGYAIAAVTAVLRSRLNQTLAATDPAGTVGNVTVSALPPDRITIGGSEPAQLNLFLYQVTPNTAYRNVQLPSVSSGGTPVTGPPLALDLHYLLTAYGAEQYFAEIILGHALRLLNDEPVLTREAIRAALNPSVPDPTLPPALAGSGLADQVEQIKVTTAVAGPEELSKLWSAMQAHYRPTVSLEARVVLIESARRTRRALPVGGVGSYSGAGMPPALDAVENTAAGPITATSTITLFGRDLAREGLLVRFGAVEHEPDAQDVGPSAITVDLSGVHLRAGVRSAQVQVALPLGDPPTDHHAFPSNSVPFLLVPVIGLTPHTTSTETIDAVEYGTGTIDVAVAPAVAPEQRVTLLLNEIGPPPGRPARSYALPAPARNGIPLNAAETTAITFAFTRVPTGDYVARLSVDGAESPLTRDGSGRYAVPGVTL